MSVARGITREDLGAFVLGTTRLGDPALDRASRMALAMEAQRLGVGFHTSHRYGDACDVIREAASLSRTGPPRCIAKVGWNEADELVGQVEDHIRLLGLQRLAVVQLCLDGGLAKDYASGGEGCEAVARLRTEGRVERCLLQVFPWSSGIALEALQRGHASELVDGYIFYFNPLQRCVSNALWEALQEAGAAIVGMRTLAGGDIETLTHGAGGASEYLVERARAVEPWIAASGARDWIEFSLRFALTAPGVVATVGATGRVERLERLSRESRTAIEPLPREVAENLFALQREWADDHDAHALPGSL